MTPQDRRAVILGGGALVLLALIWFVLLPWWAGWAETRERIDQSRQRLDELQEQAQRLIVLDRQLEPVIGAAVKKPLADVARARTQLIKDVMDLHSKSQVAIGNLQPQAARPVRELPGVMWLAVQVQGTCQVMQLVQLLADARNCSGLLLLDRVETAASPQGPGAMNVTLVWSTLARQEAAP